MPRAASSSRKYPKMPYAQYKALSPSARAAYKKRHEAESARMGKSGPRKAYSKKSRPQSSYKTGSYKAHSYSKKGNLTNAIRRDAMGGFVGRPESTVQDCFRLAEYAENASTNPITGYNQIFEQLAINPATIVGRAHRYQAGRELEPTQYKIEGYNKNYYRYEFNKCEFIITNTLPNNVSGAIGAMFIPDPMASYNGYSVLDGFNSIRSENGPNQENAIIIPRGKTGRITLPKTGLLFVKDQAGINGGDIRLSQAGQLIIFALSQFLSSDNAGGGNAPQNREWRGQVCTVKVDMSVSYVDKFQAPRVLPNLSDPNYENPTTPGSFIPAPTRAATGFSDGQVTTAPVVSQTAVATAVPTDIILPNVGSVAVYVPIFAFPTVTIGAIQEQCAVATARQQSQYGEVETITNAVDVMTAMTLGPKALFSLRDLTSIGLVDEAGNVGVKEISWAGVTKWLRSAVKGFLAIPGKIKSGLVKLFGEEAGNALYDVGKQTVTLAATSILALTQGTPEGIMYTSQGWPYIPAQGASTNGTPCIAPLQAGSSVYTRAVAYFQANKPDIYDDYKFFADQGISITIIQMPSALAYSTDYQQIITAPNPTVYPSNGPYIGQDGTLVCWDKASGNHVLLKSGFGQPDDVEGALFVEESDGVRLDNTWLANQAVSPYNPRIKDVMGPAIIPFAPLVAGTDAFTRSGVLLSRPVHSVVAPNAEQWVFNELPTNDFITYMTNLGYQITGSPATAGTYRWELEGHIMYLPTPTVASSPWPGAMYVGAAAMLNVELLPVTMRITHGASASLGTMQISVSHKNLVALTGANFHRLSTFAVPNLKLCIFIGYPSNSAVSAAF